MYQGFHASHLSFFRCPVDGGELSLQPDSHPDVVQNAFVACSCGFKASVREGILILGEDGSDDQSRRERRLRDEEYRSEPSPHDTVLDRMEIPPTLRALRLTGRDAVLELGAGSGRYTIQLANRCRELVAIDFSLEGLKRLAERLPPTSPVSLVQADISRLAVAPGSFDRVLSTLTSNLPSQALRQRMFALAAQACDSQRGLFVLGAHHWGATAKRSGISREGLYDGDGIYRYFMSTGEVCQAAAAFFRTVRARPIVVTPPGALRLHLPLVALQRILEYLPFIRSYGQIVLGICRVPKEQLRAGGIQSIQARDTHSSDADCSTLTQP
jgi:SAM-dependent methyltransferase